MLACRACHTDRYHKRLLGVVTARCLWRAGAVIVCPTRCAILRRPSRSAACHGRRRNIITAVSVAIALVAGGWA